MEAVNIDSVALEDGPDREGYRHRAARLGTLLGARDIGASVYELPPGQRTFPYHFHHGIEEWLLVLGGTPTVWGPRGERELRRGEVMCFPAGPAGAHAIENRAAEVARLLILSTLTAPSISVYPESGKVGTRPAGEADRLNFRRVDAVDYWEGE